MSVEQFQGVRKVCISTSFVNKQIEFLKFDTENSSRKLNISQKSHLT